MKKIVAFTCHNFFPYCTKEILIEQVPDFAVVVALDVVTASVVNSWPYGREIMNL